MKTLRAFSEIPTAIAAAMMMLVLTLTGCAGLPNITDADIQLLRKADVGTTIQFKPVLYESGITRWTVVGNTPELQPKEHLLQFKEIFLKETEGLLKENGYSMVEVQKNPGNGIFVEMRISSKEHVPVFVNPTAGVRLYVFHPVLKTPIEIYNWDSDSFVAGSWRPIPDDVLKEIAKKTASDLLKVLGKTVTPPDLIQSFGGTGKK